jgi:hypothetical protein
MGINPELLKLAAWRLDQDMEKDAVVPPPPAGGAPPMDPMAAGGAPPPMDPAMMGGGMPPMDPSMMGGGMPPMDPSMMGGAAPIDANQIRSIIQEELAASGGKGGSGSGGGTKKFDPEQLNRQLHTMNKFLSSIANALGVELPPEALLEPPPGEEQDQAAAPEAAAPPAGGEMPGLPGDVYAGAVDPSAGSAIDPIQPIEPAMPKTAGSIIPDNSVGRPVRKITPETLLQKTAAVAAMARQLNAR